jgi:SAM-dependent methyltransferase
MLWADMVADHAGSIESALTGFITRNNLRDTARDAFTPSAEIEQGEIANLTYRMQGSGEPLLLLPLGLAPSQWEPLLPTLSERVRTIVLSGPEVGFPPYLEERGQSHSYRRMLRDFFDLLQIQAGETILEVGCGTGVIDRYLVQYTGGRNPIVGLDQSPYLLREAAALVAKEGLASTIQLVQGDAQALQFADSSFDVTISITVMEEVDADAMFRELVRVTKAGGRIGVIVRAMDLTRPTGVLIRPELKRKYEAPPIVGVDAKGCAGIDLYRRFHSAGLVNLHRMPVWTVYQEAHGTIYDFTQRMALASLAEDEQAEWQRGLAQAVEEGTYFMTLPYHLAVGTKAK